MALKPEEILQVTKEYYESLYLSRENSIEHVDLDAIVNGPKLSEQQRKSLEGPITNAEALAALKRMENNKSSGSDGSTNEFFKVLLGRLRCLPYKIV